MKKIFLCLVTFISISSFVHSQDVATSKAEVTKQFTKEQKADMAAKKEADLVELFNRADLNADQQSKSRSVMADYSSQTKAIKTDVTLSEDDKKAKLKVLSDERNSKLIEIMGEAQYKAYQTAKKAQKEANEIAEAKKN